MVSLRMKKIFRPKKRFPLKIAFFSNGPNLPTGYGKVIRELTKRLAKDSRFSITIIDELYINQKPGIWNGIPVYGLSLPIGAAGPIREKTAEALVPLLKELQLDILVLLEDSFTLANFGFQQITKIPIKRIFYIPLDGGMIPYTGLEPIRTMDELVAMSKFTHDELLKEGFDSSVIWHGVDLQMHHPVSSDEQVRLKARYGFRPDDFVIFNYGRNSNIRKNNQGMLWVAAKYLQSAPKNHYFMMHTLQPEFPGNDLFQYINNHLEREFGADVTKRILFTPYRENSPASDDEVADMIKMCDLVITCSLGEGFGLLMAEAMASGKPIISTDYTTPYELLIDEVEGIGPRGWVVPPESVFVATLNTEHAYVNKDLFVKTMHDAVADLDEMARRGVNGRVFAEKHLNWDYLVEQWKNVFLKE